MGEKLIKITGVNHDYLRENMDENTFKVYPIEPIDKHATIIKKEYQEVEDEFQRILEIEMKKYK